MTDSLDTRRQFEDAMKAGGWKPGLIIAGGPAVWAYVDEIGEETINDDEAFEYWQKHGEAYRPPPF